MPQGHGTQSRKYIEAEHEKDKHRQKPAHVGKEHCMEHGEYEPTDYSEMVPSCIPRCVHFSGWSFMIFHFFSTHACLLINVIPKK